MGMNTTNTFHASVALVSVFALLLTTCKALRPYHFNHQSKDSYEGEESLIRRHMKEGGIGMEELYPTGSSLPDCSHACGPCSPCRRVMVSFTTCSVESCPVIYRCMCKGKYYHVPSN